MIYVNVKNKVSIMPDKFYPYNKIIREMEKSVDNCDIKILDSLKYFLRESQGEYSPSQAVTLSNETMKKIDELIYKFKEKCYCGDASSIIWGDHSAYTKNPQKKEK